MGHVLLGTWILSYLIVALAMKSVEDTDPIYNDLGVFCLQSCNDMQSSVYI